MKNERIYKKIAQKWELSCNLTGILFSKQQFSVFG